MNKNTAAICAILLMLSHPIPAWAQITEEHVEAPEISAKVWINSPPLTLGKLRGKVVLIDFWEYTCINCIRTFPYLRRWNQLYGPLALVIIGVHTPQFTFARNPQRVAEAVKRFGFTFPVAVDSDQCIWRAFHNDSWPAKYLIDKDGRLEYSHVGEGLRRVRAPDSTTAQAGQSEARLQRGPLSTPARRPCERRREQGSDA